MRRTEATNQNVTEKEGGSKDEERKRELEGVSSYRDG